MLAKLVQDLRGGALEPAFAATRALFGQHGDGAVDADREHILDALHVGIGAVVLDIRAEFAKVGFDDGVGFGVYSNLAREPEQLKGELEVD